MGSPDRSTRGGAVERLPRWAYSLVWFVVFLVAGELALLSRPASGGYALVWPPAGVSALWLLWSTRRMLPLDTALLAVATLALALRDDGDWRMLLSRTVGTLALALLFRFLTTRWTGLWGPDGRLRRLTSVGTLVGMGAAALASGLVQAVFYEALLLDDGRADLAVLVLRWLRNAIAVFTLATTGLLLWGRRHRDAAPDTGREDPLSPPKESRHPTAGPLETTILVAVSAAICYVAFFVLPGLPLSFVLFLPSAWAGLRLPTAYAALHGLATGATTVGLTLAGYGVYAGIEDRLTEALVAQVFLGIVFTTTVTLALVRHALGVSQQRSASRTEVLDRVLASVSDAIMVIDEHDRVLVLNRAGRELVGGGVDFYDSDGRLLGPESAFHRQALDGRELDGEDCLVRDPVSGTERTVRVVTRVLPQDSPGAPRRVLTTLRDVTAERAQQETLASFAGVVAHDLKNPLAVVEGWSEMLEQELSRPEGPDPSRAVRMTARIRGAATQMRTLISELLTYTLARDHDLHAREVPVQDVAEEVATHYREEAAERPLGAEIEVACPDRAWADPVLLRQMLDNLVGNAVKYVAAGVLPVVRISTSALPDGRVQVSVTDNGLGIPEEERTRVFDSFYRLDRPGYSGTGLGLAICQRIAERHGGTLEVHPAPSGGGSVFSFTLPGGRL